jgi:predicted transcriptional regulator
MTKETSDIIVTIRVPRNLDAILSTTAEREERTKAALIRLAIREYLDRHKK